MSKSVLRYPGGKTRAIKILKTFIPISRKNICSPFLGGGSFELFLEEQNKNLVCYDVFDPLVTFWKYLILDAKTLAERIQDFYPIKKNEFYNLQKTVIKIEDKLDKAAIFYVLNRCSFSGTTLSGGMSLGHPRFTQSCIDRVANFKISNRFKVECLSFEESILKHKDYMLYCDPPYIINNSLYGMKGDAHKDFNHKKLFDILDKRDNWVLSYNNCKTVLDLYKNYKIIYPDWKYGMSKNKESKEVIVFSKDLEHDLSIK